MRFPLLPLLILVAASLGLAACGDDDDVDSTAVAETTIDQVLANPGAFDDKPVVVRGTAYPVGDLGFFLASEGSSIFVAAPFSDTDKVQSGEEVTVRGELSRLDEARAGDVQDAVDTESGAPDVPAEVLPQDIRPDRPVLTLRVLYGAGEGTPPQPEGP